MLALAAGTAFIIARSKKKQTEGVNGRGINGPVRATRCNTARLRHFT